MFSMTTLHEIKGSIVSVLGVVLTGVSLEAGIYYFGGFITGVVATIVIRRHYARTK